jgi:hypothetical protein
MVVVEDDPLAIADHVKSGFEVNRLPVAVLIHKMPGKSADVEGLLLLRMIGVGAITQKPLATLLWTIPGKASVYAAPGLHT